jgi:hypothetical protein
MVQMLHRIRSPWVRCLAWSLLFVPTLYLLLLIPGSNPKPAMPAGRKPFVWNQDRYWASLESSYVAARGVGCESLKHSIRLGLIESERLAMALNSAHHPVEDTLYDAIERNTFELGPQVAACTVYLQDYVKSVRSMRSAVKNQSRDWDMNTLPARDRIYRLLYGSRAAVEEVMLQASPTSVPASIPCDEEPSSTPSAMILGVRVHSGDILVSRGGAATSALIARGNDYPGNFSHVALVHVDSHGRVSIIESHIEKGVAIASIDDYLRDTKLRIMVLRLRSDLPGLVADPLLPGKVASLALCAAQTKHVPYDFSMDFNDTTAFFCSEVVSNAYRRFGISLWMGISSISSFGVSSWLASFGVRHFETQEPSDLEYDPQLRVVSEWRDAEVLFKDHVDNAVIDVMLEGAERGERLDYDWYLLPVARIAKAYSAVLNLVNMVGPVPEGMNATAALRNTRFTTHHAMMKAEVLRRAQEFQRVRGYVPPYWELVRLAREAKTGLGL